VLNLALCVDGARYLASMLNAGNHDSGEYCEGYIRYSGGSRVERDQMSVEDYTRD
jgi:hypothetical protein